LTRAITVGSARTLQALAVSALAAEWRLDRDGNLIPAGPSEDSASLTVLEVHLDVWSARYAPDASLLTPIPLVQARAPRRE
jgi:hypothetical protein